MGKAEQRGVDGETTAVIGLLPL